MKNGGKYNGYMKNITESGNQIALHSYSHNYPQVYASEQAFLTICRKYPISYTMKRESVQTYFVFPEAAAIP